MRLMPAIEFAPIESGLVEIEQHGRMALGGQQQIGEAAEHVRTDGLALIGAGHAPDLVGRDAEMIGPEPNQPLDKSDLGAERGLDANLRLFEIDRPSRIGDGFGGDLRRHLARALPRHPPSWRPLRPSAVVSRPVLASATIALACRFAFASVTARKALALEGRLAAATSPADGMIEFGDQRPARVGLDRRDRSRARPHPEPMESQHCLGLCGTAHGNSL